ncbi:MAG TPA: TonB-dependent receptor [Anseongella sp.]|nr:TonB-dependent receptor [Anseongella sp.]
MVIALSFTCLSYAKDGLSQHVLDKRVDISARKASLTEVLSELEAKARVKFVYSENVVNTEELVSIRARSLKLKTVLDRLLLSNGIAYDVINDRIVLGKMQTGKHGGKTEREVMIDLRKSRQTMIRGKVTDAVSGQPIPGVTVTIKGTTRGTATDGEGNYSLAAAPEEIMVFAFLGYKNVERAPGSEAIVNVTLEADVAGLEQVVVVGYGTQQKKDLTGSISVVDVSDMKAQPAASAVEALQGKAAGVQIINDGAPGSTPQIRIRGYSTINNNEPLYIIDGVPFEGRLNWLNQNDIENMQVLKDASSSSIYGSRANNGVVIITTRQGQQGLPRITFDAYYGSQVPRSSAFPEMMSPQQYADFIWQSYRNAGAEVPGNWQTMYGPGADPVLPEYLLAGNNYGFDVTEADADMANYNYSRNPDDFYQITRANPAGTDWFDVITRSAPVQSYQLGASGGNEGATYAVTGGYMNQEGTILHTGFERYTVRSNTTFKFFNNKFRIGENAQYSYVEGFGVGVNPNNAGEYQGEGSGIGWGYRAPSILPVYDEGGNFAGTRGSTLGNAENPLAFLYRAKDNTNKSNQFFGNIFGEVDIIPRLTGRTSFGLRYENYTGMSMRYPNLEFSEGNNSNNLREYSGYNTEWTWTNTFTYTPITSDIHRLTVLAGTEAVKNRNRQIEGTRNDFFILGNLDYYYLGVGASNILNDGTGGLGSLFSVFGRVDYAYRDKYLASFTFRRDGSSNFGPENRYGNFPAFSLAWRISEEPFMQGAEWISDMKIRGGYGVTGNQRIPAFQYINRFESRAINSYYPINGGNNTTAGVWLSDYGNTSVKWEQLTSTNIGVDFTFFNGKVDGTFDWYQRTTRDMLYAIPLPAAETGMGAVPFVNVGDMENKGLELSLGYHYGSGRNSPFSFDLGLNLSRNVNTLTRLAPGITQQPIGNYRSVTTSILRPGEPFGAFYGYVVDGIFQNQAEVDNSPAQNGARVGGFRFRDVNGDNSISPDDRTTIGNPHPDFIYGISLNAAYGNWDISAFLNGMHGNELFDMVRYFTDFLTFDGAKSTRLLNAWSPENPGSSTPSPYNNAAAIQAESQSSTYYVQDGSFLRLKNLQVGYTLPSARLFNQGLAASQIRIYVGAANLFTLTSYTGLDPEVSQSYQEGRSLPGVDQGIYPIARQFLLGVNATF